MLRLFRFLIWGDAHLHKWVPYGKRTNVFLEDEDEQKGTPAWRHQSFQCETCGMIRIFKI